jgi:hypothetical protein
MPTCVLLSLILLRQIPSRPVAKAPGIEIVIQDRAIELPLLPEGVEQARAGFVKIRPDITTALQDLERDLEGIYAALAREGPSTTFYRTPSNPTAEGHFLASMLEDDACLALEDAVFDEWVHWQTRLLRYGLSLPSGGSEITSRMVLLAVKRNELRSQDRSDLPRPFFDLLAVDGLDYTRWGSLARGASGLANTQAPQLARAWKPLAQHLNETALKMLEFERTAAPTQDSTFRILRLQAKLNMLERFRSALWFCQLVWAHMASSPLPKPLKQLGKATR